MLHCLLYLASCSAGRPRVGESAKDRLRRLYGSHKVMSYRDARILMYNEADCKNDQLVLQYTGVTFPWKCHQSLIPSATMVNAEHTVPQSFFAKKLPMVSDLHHLLASPAKLNGMRSNYPFVQIDYSQCSQFCRGFECSSDFPSNPSEYSCLSKTKNSWMPRDADKGRVARAVLYFFTMYDGVDIKQVGDVQTFLQWNMKYPPSDFEKRRNDILNTTQGNRNPYVDDPSLASQVF